MKVFTCNDHSGFYPVGTASVIVAEDMDAADLMLTEKLIEMGLDPKGYTLQELDTEKPAVVVLRDGDY